MERRFYAARITALFRKVWNLPLAHPAGWQLAYVGAPAGCGPVPIPGRDAPIPGARATFMVSTLPPDGEPVQTAPALPEGLGSADAAARRQAVKAVVALGAAAAPTLVEALGRGESRLRASAATALAELAKAVQEAAVRASAVDALLIALGDPEPETRRAVAAALGEFGDARAYEALLAALGDADGALRGEAAMALGALGDARAIAPLADRLAHTVEEERSRVAVGLGRLGDARGLQILRDEMRDRNVLTRCVAALGLALTRNAQAVPVLVAGLRDSDRLVRMACVDALAEFDSPEAWRALSALQNERDTEVRALVERALRKMRERNPGLVTSPAAVSTPAEAAQPHGGAESPLPTDGAAGVEFIIPHGDVALDGAQMIIKRKRFSSETTSLALDDLRLAYLFMPTEFTWRPLRTSSYQYHWVNLDALAETDYGLLSAALGQQNRILLRDCVFVMLDTGCRAVSVRWQQLAGRGLDLLSLLWEGREARRAKTARWLETNPAITIDTQRGLFRSAANLNAAGIAARGKRYVPWNELEKFNIVQVRGNLGTSCNLDFRPPKASGRKGVFLAVDPKWTEACLALVDFWRTRAGDSVAQTPAPPEPAGEVVSWARVSLAAGILEWILLPIVGALLAIVSGHLAQRQLRRSGGALRGKGQALAGMILGYGQLALVLLVMVASLAASRPGSQAARGRPVGTSTRAVVVARTTPTAGRQVVVSPTSVTQKAATGLTARVVTSTAAAASPTPAIARSAVAMTPTSAATRYATATAAPKQGGAATPTLAVSSTPSLSPQDALALGQALRATVEANPTFVAVANEIFDNNVLGWPTGTTTNEFATLTQALVNQTYRWDIEALQGVHSSARLNAAPVSTFILSADVQQISGPDSTHGLAVCIDGNNQYSFGVTNNQYFTFVRLVGGQWTPLIDWTPAAVIRPWQMNRLTVVAGNGRFVLLINDQFVGMADDDRIPQGQVGFVVGLNKGTKASFAFDNLKLQAAVMPAGAAPAISKGGRARVVPAPGLMMRQSPRTDAAAVRMLPQGAILDVIGGPQEVAGLVWWQVRTSDGPSQEGWVVAGMDGSVFIEPAP